MHKIGKYISADEVTEQADNMSVQINLLWGTRTIHYERLIMEFKLGLPDWQEYVWNCYGKKNHCSNNNALEGLGFKIDEIIQAWNEMYEAKTSSFRLEPLLGRRVSKCCFVWGSRKQADERHIT
ncbi:hypothetical protein GQ457_03G016440 [Hibiscus cannabinus]